jgi:acyl-CoA hydrolase
MAFVPAARQSVVVVSSAHVWVPHVEGAWSSHVTAHAWSEEEASTGDAHAPRPGALHAVAPSQKGRHAPPRHESPRAHSLVVAHDEAACFAPDFTHAAWPATRSHVSLAAHPHWARSPQASPGAFTT